VEWPAYVRITQGRSRRVCFSVEDMTDRTFRSSVAAEASRRSRPDTTWR
jgi:hypothetical protein